MATNSLERRFIAIGARMRIAELLAAVREIDVATDRHGEVFELRVAGHLGAEAAVVDVDRDDRALVLLLRDGGEKRKFLCGFDERHWFVAAIPESARGVRDVSRRRTRSSRRPFARPSPVAGRRTGSAAGTCVRQTGRVVLPAAAEPRRGRLGDAP